MGDNAVGEYGEQVGYPEDGETAENGEAAGARRKPRFGSKPKAPRERKARVYTPRVPGEKPVPKVSAFDAALTFLGYRARSVNEVRKRLLQKGHQEVDIEAAVARLVELKYLDDEAFAVSWTASRERSKPMSSLRVRQELRALGVDAITAEEAAPRDEDTDIASAITALRKAWGRWSKDAVESRQKKAQGFLLRRGFGYSAVKNALAAVESDADE